MTSAMTKLIDGLRADPLGYTVLVGAGVSRSAGIATGQDLLAQLSASQCAVPAVGSLVDWYVETYGRWPSYEAILYATSQGGITACTAACGDGVLIDTAVPNGAPGALFEPTAAERAAGIKVPKPAHRALAALAAAGYLRLLLTTNFDRLLEAALVAADVPTRVLATPETIAEALPLPARTVTVVKLHGDWIALRPKVLLRRQVAYADVRIAELLAGVFAEHHLIICGWSAEWDVALRAAVATGPTHRAVYWASVGETTAAMAAVIASRRVEIISISSADCFLSELVIRLLGAPLPTW